MIRCIIKLITLRVKMKVNIYTLIDEPLEKNFFYSVVTDIYFLLFKTKYIYFVSLCGRGRKEMFYLTTHSTHFIYGYMASDIWLRTIPIVRKETRCRHIGYSFRLTARVLLYAPSHRQDSTYHGLCYTSRGALAGLVFNSKQSKSITYLIK